MEDRDAENPQDRLEQERRAFRRLIGSLLFPIALFPLFSMVTYNWRDISWLNSPPLSPPSNLIGIVGAWSVFVGYSLFGLALWLLPLFVLLFSGMLIYGRVMRIGRRMLWGLLFVVALCCLVQLGSDSIFSDALERLNLKPNAGGAIGYWLMTCLLARWFSPVGGGILMLSIMLFALVMAIGLRSLFAALGRLTGWWETKQARAEENAQAEENAAADEGADDGLTPRERERARRQEMKEAAKRAKEEARLAREEERRLAESEREAERARREEEKTRREEERAEQQRVQEEERARIREMSDYVRETELIRRRAEEARQAAARERERLQREEQAAVERAKEMRLVAAKETASDAAAAPAAAPAIPDEYPLPPISLLNPVPDGAADYGDISATESILVDTLRQFNVPVEVIGTTPGPVVTQYELRPAPNIKVERIASLTANLQMALEATSLRVQAPIPGKNAVGVEIPNRRARPVTLREVVEGEAWRRNSCEVPLALGKDVAGNDLIFDLTKAPHLLVAGATGSGKSVCLNAILTGFMMSRTPEQLRLILVDPKRVEFTCYNELPHLLVPVINDPKKVAFGLRWAITEMEKRYRLLQKAGCRNIVGFNHRQQAKQVELFEDEGCETQTPAAPAAAAEDVPATLPYIVIVVDEVADIMAAVGKEVEPAIARLTSLSRAVGIHLILATQRPSVDVITGTIKSNIPGRIAFKVSQSNDSRTILDSPGAEELIGKGDMLFLKEGSQLMRAQGAWVGDDEIARIVSFVKEHCRPCYDQTLIGRLDKIKEADPEAAMNEGEGGEEDDGEASSEGESNSDDELLPNALEVIRLTRRASTTMLQRRLRIGYTRAARLMDILEERGVVGPQVGSGTRDILIDLDNEIPAHAGLPGEDEENSPAEPPRESDGAAASGRL